MKKLVLLVVVCVLAGSLVACARGGNYKPGTYAGEGTRRTYGYETAEVTVDQKKITKIILHRVEPGGQEVDYEKYSGTDPSRPNLKQIREDMAREMLDKQTYDVDTVTGATDSSQGWKAAVKQALDKAKR